MHAVLLTLLLGQPLRFATGEPVILPHGRAVGAVAFAPDGRSLVTLAREPGWAPAVGVARLWDLPTRRERLAWRTDQVSYGGAAFTADGKAVVLAGAARLRGGLVEVRDATTGKVGTTATAPWPLATVAVAGTLVVASGQDPSAPPGLWSWTLPDLKPGLREPQAGGTGAGAFDSQGATFVSGLNDRTVMIRDAAGAVKTRFPTPEPVTALAMSPDGQTVAAAVGRSVRIWDVATGRARFTQDHPAAVECLAFSPSGRTLAVGTGNPRPAATEFPGGLHFWDVATGRARITQTELSLRPLALAFSPDGLRLAAGLAGPATGPGSLPGGDAYVWDVGALYEKP
jgi:WD40 repeat protein